MSLLLLLLVEGCGERGEVGEIGEAEGGFCFWGVVEMGRLGEGEGVSEGSSSSMTKSSSSLGDFDGRMLLSGSEERSASST